MKALQQYTFSENHSASHQISGEQFLYLIVKRNTIHISDKEVGLDPGVKSVVSSIDDYIGAIIDKGEKCPVALVFDMGIGVVNLKELTHFLQNNRYCKSLLVLWNSSHLSVSEMHQLIELSIVDDFIEGSSEIAVLERKVQFLLKYKQNYSQAKLGKYRIGHSNDGIPRSVVVFKRLFDVVVSLILLTFLLPLFILVGLAIKLETRGPIFYVSNRVGKNYRVFPMIKFRSMQHGADKVLEEISHLNIYGEENKTCAFVKIKNDPRVSQVGKFLRKTSIDEFPQLLNVLMGHMSIVGNRPLPLYEAEKLLVNDYVSRFDAPAGITGLWQVIKKDNPDMNEEERIALDIRYSRECSIIKDLWIIFKTPGALLQNQNY
ncbi:MAG: hypothetical protein RL642_1686 [Bacteroidota bacterium]|jgi:lipopolysaccharide/colanic/teichoic acid biosynthesis glycosyltransferase